MFMLIATGGTTVDGLSNAPFAQRRATSASSWLDTPEDAAATAVMHWAYKGTRHNWAPPESSSSVLVSLTRMSGAILSDPQCL